MRWPELLRFWLPAWLRDPEAFLREVDDAVARATVAEPVPSLAPDTQAPPVAAETEPVRPEAPPVPAQPTSRARARAKAQPAAGPADSPSPAATAAATSPAPAPAKRTRKKAGSA
jgi:hypothetical protein